MRTTKAKPKLEAMTHLLKRTQEVAENHGADSKPVDTPHIQMKTPTGESKRPTTPDERKSAKMARKEHRARVRLIIETYDWLIQFHAKAG